MKTCDAIQPIIRNEGVRCSSHLSGTIFLKFPDDELNEPSFFRGITVFKPTDPAAVLLGDLPKRMM